MIRLSFVVLLAMATLSTVHAQEEATVADGEAAVDPNEAAIRKAIDSYVAAFNKGDAKAVAEHWTENGEMITPAGERIAGREQLISDFATYFKERENVKIELVDTAIDMVSPSVAVETGVARVLVPEQEPSETVYEAIHVQTAAGWKIDSVREQEPAVVPPSHYEQLQSLAWMTGRWIDQDESGTVETNCRWTTNQNFLVRSFKVVTNGQVDFEGTQVIGWDPSAGAIRSWTFDSDGGFGVGLWNGEGNRWTVQTLNVMPDGRRASATNIYEQIDDNTATFRSIGRQAAGELLPSIGPFTVVRADAE